MVEIQKLVIQICKNVETLPQFKRKRLINYKKNEIIIIFIIK